MFWSSDTLKAKQETHRLVWPFDSEAVKHAAYELKLGEEAFLTSFGSRTKKNFRKGKHIQIPPGQFGLLMTKEVVRVPLDAIAFISIRAGIKFRGLVNISGFHVDPGFEGKLKFAVYNAGSQTIILKPEDPIFMIWYANLDRETDGYGGLKPGANEITSANITAIQGDIASPAALKESFDDLKGKVRNLQWLFGLLVTAIAAALIPIFLTWFYSISSAPSKNITNTASVSALSSVKNQPASQRNGSLLNTQ